MEENVRINGKRAYLRPLQPADAAVSCHWRNDTEIWLYTLHRPERIITEDIERAWIEKGVCDPSVVRLALCLKGSGQYIGNIQLSDVTKDDAQYHVFIGQKELWGQGYAYEGGVMMLEYLSSYSTMKKLYTWVHVDNIGSLKSLQRMGFTFSSSQRANYLHGTCIC